MASFAGNFLCNTSTGNQSITGAGFQPKLVLFFGCALTAAQTTANDSIRHFGAMIATKQFAGSLYRENTTSPSVHLEVFSTTHCINQITAASATLMAASFVSFDADGFTIDWSTAPATARRIFFLALSGPFNVDTGTFTTSTTGNKSVTGIGFLPQVVFCYCSNGSATVKTESYGVGVSSTSRWATHVMGQTNQASPPQKRGQRTDKFLVKVANTDANLQCIADLVSMDADGFTFNVSNHSANTFTWAYIAINNLVAAALGAVILNDVAISVSGLGFQPDAILLYDWLLAASSSQSASGIGSLGVCDSALNVGATVVNGQDGAPVNSRAALTNRALSAVGGGSGATISSLTGDGFNVASDAAFALLGSEAVYMALLTEEDVPLLPILGVN
jgi:hypothetical protein